MCIRDRANTPITAPNIINMYWSLIATAVVILSIENAKSVIERSTTTLKNLKILKIKVLSIDLIKNEKYLFMSNNSRPGIILAIVENEGIIISTKTDPIILLEAKLEGKNISSKTQLIQQLKPSAGEYLSD